MTGVSSLLGVDDTLPPFPVVVTSMARKATFNEFIL
jgi:hypothetical protein